MYLFIYLFIFLMKFVLFQEDRSPAFFASKKGHTQTLALLLENKADAYAKDRVCYIIIVIYNFATKYKLQICCVRCVFI